MSFRDANYFKERNIVRTLLLLPSKDKERLVELSKRYKLSQAEVFSVLMDAAFDTQDTKDKIELMFIARSEQVNERPMSKRAIAEAIKSATPEQLEVIKAALNATTQSTQTKGTQQ